MGRVGGRGGGLGVVGGLRAEVPLILVVPQVVERGRGDPAPESEGDGGLALSFRRKKEPTPEGTGLAWLGLGSRLQCTMCDPLIEHPSNN